MPLFKRGPEVELASQQDVEMLKQTLAANKVHIPTKSLEKGIIMPRDLENYHPGYLQVQDFLIQNPYPKVKEVKKKKTKGGKKEALAAAQITIHKYVPLEHNAKLEYRPFEFGNLPLKEGGKPQAGQWRLMLPSEADWTVKVKEVAGEKD
jgi:hypothetical protein